MRKGTCMSSKSTAWLSKSVALVLVMSAQLATLPAQAGSDAGRPPYTQTDWALLPEWCIQTQDGESGDSGWTSRSGSRNPMPRSERLAALFGEDFFHMHHFCRGLYAERRQLRADLSDRERRAAIVTAIDEYRYLIRNCAETMPLMPEVYFRLGEMHLRIEERPQASEAFASARRIKPDYWPAYTRWADELISLRLLHQAEALVDQGLSYSPAQTQLIERKQRLLAARRGAGQPAP
jgi:hypothetical protein